MRKQWWIMLLMAFGLVSTAWMVRGAEKAKKEEKEVKVKFEQLPDAVKKAFEKEAQGAKITEADKETTKDGKVVYEADVTIDGKNWEIKVAEDGKLIKKKLDEENEDKDEEHEDED